MSANFNTLTKAEMAVVRAARAGVSAQAIADQLVISRRTVETHLGAAYRKLGISSRAELVALLHESGLGDSSTPGLWPLPKVLRPAARFVGRESELSMLNNLTADTREGHGRLLIVRGEPGVGKSAIVAEACRHAAESGAAVLVGRCDPDLRAPMRPIAAAIRPLLTRPGVDLLALVGPSGGFLASIFPDLEDLLPPRLAVDDSATARTQVFDAILHVLAVTARACPVLLVIDDLQWADQATASFVAHLASASDLGSVSVIATHRNDPVLGSAADLLLRLAREESVTNLDLSGLTSTEVAEFASVTTGHKMAPTEAENLRRQTGGNPFYLAQIFRRTDVSGGPSNDLSELVRARVRQLGQDPVRILQAAAVLGDGFDTSVLAAMLEISPDDVEKALTRVVGAGLVTSVDDYYRFAHDLVREALITELTSLPRARLHRQAGRAILSSQGESASAIALARHFGEAAPLGEGLLAARYGLAAAREARTRLAPDDAVSFAETALSYLPRAGQDATTDDLRLELLLVLVDAHETRMDLSAAHHATLRAIEVARGLGDPTALARVVDRNTVVPVMGTLDEDLLNLKREAIATLGTEATALRNRLLVSISYQRTIGGHGWAASEEAEQAIADARALGDADSLVGGLYAVASASMGRPDLAPQLEVADELIAAGAGRVDLLPERDGRRFRAILRLASGDRAGFEADLVDLAEFGERCGSIWVRSLVASWRTLLALLDGDLVSAEQRAGEVLAISGDEPNFMLGWFVQLVNIRQAQDRSAEMAPLAQMTFADHPEIAALRALTAGLLLDCGEVESAREMSLPLVDGAFAQLSEDWLRPATLAYLAPIVRAMFGPGERKQLADLLEPYAGQLLVVGAGSLVLGAADHFRGILLAEGDADQREGARSAFRSAISLSEGAGAHALALESRLELAAVSASSEVDLDELAHIQREARERGLARVERRAGDLIASRI